MSAPRLVVTGGAGGQHTPRRPPGALLVPAGRPANPWKQGARAAARRGDGARAQRPRRDGGHGETRPRAARFCVAALLVSRPLVFPREAPLALPGCAPPVPRPLRSGRPFGAHATRDETRAPLSRRPHAAGRAVRAQCTTRIRARPHCRRRRALCSPQARRHAASERGASGAQRTRRRRHGAADWCSSRPAAAWRPLHARAVPRGDERARRLRPPAGGIAPEWLGRPPPPPGRAAARMRLRGRSFRRSTPAQRPLVTAAAAF
jgi:hypothetical protein